MAQLAISTGGLLSSSRAAFATGRPLLVARREVVATPSRSCGGLQIEARYRGKNTDRSRVAAFQRSELDTGSTEVQVARIQARVQQLTKHLQEHKHDFKCERGLVMLLAKRRHFLLYLYKHARPKYDNLIQKLNIRPVKIQAARGVEIKLQAAARAPEDPRQAKSKPALA